MAVKNDDLVEIRPLQPFVGTYRCALAEADMVDDDLEDRDGVVVKTKVPKKRIIGLISVRRFATVAEIEAAVAGEPMPGIEFLAPEELKRIKPSMMTMPQLAVIQHPRERTVRVPASIAEGLIERGLAERVGKTK